MRSEEFRVRHLLLEKLERERETDDFRRPTKKSLQLLSIDSV